MHQEPGGGRAGWCRHGRRPPGLYGLPGPAAELVAVLRELAALELGAFSADGLTVEDLAQEACLRLLRGTSPPQGWDGRGADSWAGWLRLLVRNLAQSHRARELRRRAAMPGGSGPHHGMGATGPRDGFERVDEALDPPLASLPAGLRSVAVLVLAGLPVGEAACTLDLTDAELQRRALLAAWVLAEGELPPARGPAGLPAGARARNGLLDAVSRRRRDGWSWVALGSLLQVDWRSLRRAARRRDTRNHP